MSEKLAVNHEVKTFEASAESEQNLHRIHEKAESAEQFSDQQIETIRTTIEQEAFAGKEINPSEHHKDSVGAYGSHQELKTTAYNRTLSSIQSRLKGPEKGFSKLIHKPTIEKLSNFGSQTVARPSGILGGGVCALIGSSLLVYLSKHYGFEYNYLVFVILFIAGYLVGSLLEIVVRLLFRHRK